MKSTIKIILVAYIFALTPLAQAYVGPGAGLSAIGSILAFVGAFLLLILGFLWYPFKRLIKSIRGKQNDSSQEISLEKSPSDAGVEKSNE